MRQTVIAALAASGLYLAAGVAQAATFAGYSETADVYFDDVATFDFEPAGLGGSVADLDLLVDIQLSPDLTAGFLTLFNGALATVLDGSLLDTVLSVDNDLGDDTFSMLFSLSAGSQPYAIATFTGDLDGFGFSDFFTEGVLFVDGGLKIVGATEAGAAIIPLPAGVVLLVTGLAAMGGLGATRRRGHPGLLDAPDSKGRR
ncbi:hypothetical protein [Rhodovulum sulfidophilum]|uniref:hypothetical protein n=1 Tax=Rhodovulum sulfidophilum TaxID=35806 RepID=UPI00138A1407|nr:hypothetical protein [Rhodovulum sulfidophilum]NDK36984.1 hypothetical protein [Rhodovulum sulfidophilum]